MDATIFFFFFFLIFFFFAAVSRSWLRLPPSHLPPGPPWPLPAFGHLHLLGSLPHRTLHALSHTYGPLLFLRLGVHPTVVVSNASFAKFFLHDHDLHFSSRPSMLFSRLVFYGRGSALMQPDGLWRTIRKLYTQELLSPKSVLAYRSIRDEEISRLVRKLRQREPGAAAIDIRSLACDYILNVMTRVLFGQRSDEGLLTEFPRVYKKVGEFFPKPLLADYVPYLWWLDHVGRMHGRITKLAKQMDAILESVITARVMQIRDEVDKRKLPNDILTSLLEQFGGGLHRLDTNEWLSGTPNSNKDTVKASVLELLTGSTDTTAAVIEWAMAELLRDPGYGRLERLKKEIMGAKYADGYEKLVLQESDLSKMPYLQAVIKETMRLHPSAPLLLPHMANEATNVGGFRFPQKTRLIINVWAIGRDESVWEEASKFRPERFLSSNSEEGNVEQTRIGDGEGRHESSVGLEQYKFLPFGRGRRSCPGSHLGLSMATSLLANLLHAFDWQTVAASSGSGIAMDEVLGTSISLQKPLMLFPIPLLHNA